jgi:hypothetical protein
MNKMDAIAFFAGKIKKHRRIVELFKQIANHASPETVALLDYPIRQRQRWNQERPHEQLYKMFDQQRDVYAANLREFTRFAQYYAEISEQQPADPKSVEPFWINQWIPSLDGIALYALLAINKPKLFLEVGSGNSTKFARKAILDHHLNTKIVSIDPCPRAEINAICDEVIRKPVEDVDVCMFDRLDANDILYIDNSHRVFMNSDVTMMFLDVLPRLRPGVLVEIHDITLPYDYPTEWVNRYYSEQYVLAAYLLAKGNLCDVVLPGMFITRDAELRRELAPIWENEVMKNVKLHGCSFWIKMK